MPTVPETQLQIYNDALKLCEERSITSAELAANSRKPCRLLNDVWNGGGVNACLEESDWDFARRTIAATFNPSIQPDFGYIHAFQHPADWLRTSAVSSEPYFNSVYTLYADEAGYWWSDLTTIYVKYVSSNIAYGGNLALWTESFKQFCAAHFAWKIVGNLTHDKVLKKEVFEEYERLRTSARSKDAMNEPASFFPRGQLTRARRGRFFGDPGRSDSSGI